MNNNFEITALPGGDMKMNLRNGSVEITREGNYIISTGCGTGKTMTCRSIIKNYSDKGVLYCVDTIAELEKMYEYAINEAGINPLDILILDQQKEGTLKVYRKNPEIVMQKKVLLVTHVRFWTEMINYFLIYNPSEHIDPFTGDFETLMKRNDLRKYILFDETPQFVKPFLTIPKYVMGMFEGCTKEEMKKKYNKYIKGTPVDPIKKGNDVFNQIKREVMLSVIERDYDDWVTTKPLQNYDMVFNWTKLCQRVVKSHVFIFEGAGDMLFNPFDPHYTYIDLTNKYNCQIVTEHFDFDLTRRDSDETPGDKYNKFFDWLKDRLKQNEIQGRKSLVVVWKSLGNRNDTAYYEKVKEDLNRTNLSNYSITYYGASDTKSTNEYRDYTDIIFCGKWTYPKESVGNFDVNFGTNTNLSQMNLWYFIQTACRIGIRKGDGETYRIWWSSDYNENLPSHLEYYLGNGKITHKETETGKEVWLKSILNNFSPKYQKFILRFVSTFPEAKDNIRIAAQTTISMSFSDFAKIAGVTTIKRSRLNSYLKILEKLNIYITLFKGSTES